MKKPAKKTKSKVKSKARTKPKNQKSATKKSVRLNVMGHAAEAAKLVKVGTKVTGITKGATHTVVAVVGRKAKAAKPGAAGKRETVTAEQVAKFICAPGGRTMADITEQFGIDAHPMRAKIHRAKHVLGYVIEHKDGRYHGVAPQQTA